MSDGYRIVIVSAEEAAKRKREREQRQIREMSAKLRELRGKRSSPGSGPAEVLLLAPGGKRRDN